LPEPRSERDYSADRAMREAARGLGLRRCNCTRGLAQVPKQFFKLFQKLQARLKTVRTEAEFLAQAEIKLSAAIVAALLSKREG
jgi:hypothetical protein